MPPPAPTRSLAASGPNAEQIELWNDNTGPRWVALQDQLDAMISPFGELVLEHAAPKPGERALDVGCGCGQTSLQLAQRVGRRGRVFGVDISGVMLARAKERATAAGATQLEFQLADAQTAALPRAAFDLIFSRFGVMFFADPVAAFTNLRRALVKGGRLAFVCWQALPKNPWMAVPLAAAAQQIKLPPPPLPGSPGPFAFADPERVARILDQAGFSEVALEAVDTSIAVGRGIDEAIRFLLEGAGPTTQALREASEAEREVVRGAVRKALEPYQTPRGVEMAASVWIATARSG